MGILTDPSLKSRSKFGRLLAQHKLKLCLVLYVAGLIWFACLAHPSFYHSTYLSENALSPGLVYPEMKQDSVRLAQQYWDELKRERESHRATTPTAWIMAKMRQIGLEVHVHNFTLHYPFTRPGEKREYHGRNVYGILRAPRVGSTEGVIYAAPYRPPSSVHTDISASVPVLLAFAEFARRKNYWAKDLIFLVTEQEQLGMYAWLEAYYEGGIQGSSVLKCGNLLGRAGSLQAALNLEIQDLDIDFVDVKIEGLNGQLPNLDMFNLVQRIMAREGIPSGYKHSTRKHRSTKNNVESNLYNMLEMLLTQSTGMPTGNHGLFHRYRVESLTLEAYKRDRHSHNRPSNTLSLLKALEGISRSLNNLLERFHQSFFFYILIHSDHFVSIGDFMPSLGLMVAPLFLKAFLLWLSIGFKKDDRESSNSEEAVDGDNEEEEEEETEADESELASKGNPYSVVLLLMAQAFFIGFLCNVLPVNQYLREYFASHGVDSSTAVGLLIGACSVLGLVFPLLVRLPPEEDARDLLHIATLVFSGVTLIVTGLLNFSLGFFVAALAVPLLLLISTDASSQISSVRKSLTRLYALLLNPAISIYILVLALTLAEFPELPLKQAAWRALNAAKDGVTFALMDSLIYGNWLYTAVSAVFFPLWIACWSLVTVKSMAARDAQESKVNTGKLD